MWGNLVRVKQDSGEEDENENPIYSYVQFYYDWAGRMTHQVKGLSDIWDSGASSLVRTNPNYSLLTYEYDYLGNVTK